MKSDPDLESESQHVLFKKVLLSMTLDDIEIRFEEPCFCLAKCCSTKAE